MCGTSSHTATLCIAKGISTRSSWAHAPLRLRARPWLHPVPLTGTRSCAAAVNRQIADINSQWREHMCPYVLYDNDARDDVTPIHTVIWHTTECRTGGTVMVRSSDLCCMQAFHGKCKLLFMLCLKSGAHLVRETPHNKVTRVALYAQPCLEVTNLDEQECHLLRQPPNSRCLQSQSSACRMRQ